MSGLSALTTTTIKDCLDSKSRQHHPEGTVRSSRLDSTTQNEPPGLHVSAVTALENDFVCSLPLPRAFAGARPELWEDFTFNLKAYVNMLEHDFSNYMDLASAFAEQVTDERHVLEQA